MSTGGIQLLFGAVNPKSRNGSQRTIVMSPPYAMVSWVRWVEWVGDNLFDPTEPTHLTCLPSRTVWLLRLRIFRVDDFRVFHVRVARGLRGLSRPSALRLLVQVLC